eukprot:CAMPEP_0194432460 /NCGR_PEP_ID=MMETSP0176-20130528/70573_1 /TAXON_ID=216777 /ORGANISM="Proboscia alata, Strain PI-D3" /LENGTH=54 /DNA_ID=CAMNT_0039248741 /DNA_START=137 /DNA_END=297 /DNA_ORIENTATION=+
MGFYPRSTGDYSPQPQPQSLRAGIASIPNKMTDCFPDCGVCPVQPATKTNTGIL